MKKWNVTDEPAAPKNKDNIFLAAVYLFIKSKIHFEGSATELVEQLKFVSDEEFHSNRVHGGRKIILNYNSECDSNDSKNGSGVAVTKQLAEVLQMSI